MLFIAVIKSSSYLAIFIINSIIFPRINLLCKLCNLFRLLPFHQPILKFFFFAVEPQRKSLPVRNMVSQLKIVPVRKNKSEFIWTTTYELKFGLLGKLLNKLKISRFFKKGLENNIIAIEEHVRTGRIIGENDLKVTPITGVPS